MCVLLKMLLPLSLGNNLIEGFLPLLLLLFLNLRGKSGFSANVIVDVSQSKPSQSPFLSFTNDQMMKLMALINDRPSSSIHANMAGWITDSGANQHMTVTTKNMFDITDISDLDLTVGHPNGTLAKIKYVGNLQLSNNVVLYDVLVVPEYCVSLLSVHKLIKDSIMFVSFDENKCYIQDVTQNRIMGIGSKTGGLYLFDQLVCQSLGKSVGITAYVSKSLWHSRLGHPADQFIDVLHDDLQMTSGSHVSPYDICHMSKQTRNPSLSVTISHLLLVEHRNQLAVLELLVLRMVLQLLWVIKASLRAIIKTFKNVFDYAGNNNNDDVFNIPPGLFPIKNNNDVQPEPSRRSSRVSKIPAKFNDYVVNSSKRYGLEKVDAMIADIEALNRNNTWIAIDLPVGRKPIGSKWIFKIKYKASREIERYKARLVAKGFSQKEDIHYEETFSLVVKMTTVRCLINIVVQNDWPLYLCLLVLMSKYDYSLFTKGSGTYFVALLVYVDDIVITRIDDKEIERFKSFLKEDGNGLLWMMQDCKKGYVLTYEDDDAWSDIVTLILSSAMDMS
ncbi:ribonuclease H-like domain-containing protein [Tanacetum coccineum]